MQIKIFENPPRNNIEKIKNKVKPKAKANKPKKVVEISDDEEPKDYSNILTKIEKIKDIKKCLTTLDNDTKNKIIKGLNLDPRILMRKPKRKNTTNIEDLSRSRKNRREPRHLTTEQLVERKRKRKEKQRLKPRQDTVEGLQDFNRSIRVKSPRKDKKGLTQKILNKRSSIAIENNQKIYIIINNRRKYQIIKNLIRKAKNSIYEKDIVFLICMII